MGYTVAKMIKRGLVGFFVSVVLVAAVVGFAMFEESSAKRELSPPDGLQTMKELRPHLPSPTHVERIENGGARYTVWWAPVQSGFLWVPSGAPAYVFDDGDHLVMWTHETGDGDEVTQLIESSRATN
jgi:hypothetical protein